jgi:nuclease HARBI1
MLSVLSPIFNDYNNLCGVFTAVTSPFKMGPFAHVVGNLANLSQPEGCPRPMQAAGLHGLGYMHSRAENACGGFSLSFYCILILKLIEQLYTRFTANEIEHLIEAMDVPPKIVMASHYSFMAVEALCLLLARFRSAADIYELSSRYDRTESAISEIVNELVHFLDYEWSHLLDFDTEGLMSRPNLASYVATIYTVGAPIHSILGFIDCTIRHICRPSWFQCVTYSGHKKHHALKFQAVCLPNGMFGHLFGLVEGCHADPWLLTESWLVDALWEHATREGTDENTLPKDRSYQVFGDPAYGVSWHIQSPFAGPSARTEDEQDWNNAWLVFVFRLSMDLGMWFQRGLSSMPGGSRGFFDHLLEDTTVLQFCSPTLWIVLGQIRLRRALM